MGDLFKVLFGNDDASSSTYQWDFIASGETTRTSVTLINKHTDKMLKRLCFHLFIMRALTQYF